MRHVLWWCVQRDTLFAGSSKEHGQEAVVVLLELLELFGEQEGAERTVRTAKDDRCGEAVRFYVFAKLVVKG